MRVFLTVLLAAALVSGSAHAQGSDPVVTMAPAKRGSTLKRAISIFLNNDLTKALPLFRQAIEEEPGNPDAYAWLAETYRRTDSPDEAHDMARRALAIQPCNAQAHTTLADLYNPQYSSWERVDFDSTWAHQMKAVECDPSEGVAWFGIWIEAMRTGATEIETRALRSLASSGFITPGALAYARWKLASLPKDAILLTNGDMDTYPLVTLQASQGFRTDVAVVNASLLNLNWYGSLMTRRHEITGGLSVEQIESLEDRDVDARWINTISRQIIARWIEARRRGTLKRPIAISVGVDWSELVRDIKGFTLVGPHWIYDTGKKPRALDAAAIRESLRGLDPKNFSGPFVSERDRSPIRRAYSAPVAAGAVTGDLGRAADAMEKIGTKEATREAAKLNEWIEKFYRDAGRVEEPTVAREPLE